MKNTNLIFPKKNYSQLTGIGNTKRSFNIGLKRLRRARQAAINVARAQNAVANVQDAAYNVGQAQAAAQGQGNRDFTIEDVTRWITMRSNMQTMPGLCKAIFSRGKITCHF